MICKTLWKITLLQTSEIRKSISPPLTLYYFSLPVLSPCPTFLPKTFSASWPILYSPIFALRTFMQTIFTFIALEKENITPNIPEKSAALNYFEMWQLPPYVTYNIHILLVYRAIAYSWQSARIYIGICGLVSSAYSSTNWREMYFQFSVSKFTVFSACGFITLQPAKFSNNVMC